jgi:TatD DNase family protein
MYDPNPDLIDYHCHLDLYQDFAEQFRACDANRIATLAVTTTPRAWEMNRRLAEKSKFVRAALGLHPQLVGEFAHEVALFEKLLPEARFIGEIGLDASPRYFASFPKQKATFERILKLCADAGGKILSIHSVRAGKQTLDMLEQHLPAKRGTAILHWFSGTSGEARRASGLGCYFSLNREMFRDPKRRDLVASLPIDRILTESDGPFIRTGTGPSKPADIKDVIPMIAAAFARTEGEIKTQLAQNLAKIEAGLV